MINNSSFYYDPQRQGYDTNLWKTLDGNPIISGNNLILNSSSIVHYADMYQARIVFDMIFPTLPTVGDIRFVGLAQLSPDLRVGFFFEDNAVFAQSQSDTGTTNVPLEWNDAWVSTPIKLEIRWRGFEAKFYIEGIKVATINALDNGLVYRPTSLYIQNQNADNLEIVAINALDITKLI